MDEMWDIVVVGGGIAGLAAAGTAAGNGYSVLLVDGVDGGGRAATDQVGRFRFNRGAHALYRGTPGRAVLDRLGVRVEGSPPPLKGSLGRLGDENGTLPVGAATGMRTSLLGARDKVAAARILAGTRRWKPDTLAGKTANEWFDDLGVDGTFRQVMEAFGRLSTYTPAFDTVSADLVAGALQAASVHGVQYLKGGWAALVDGLTGAARRRGAALETSGHKVRTVTPEGRRSRVETEGGTFLAQRVVLAAGTPEGNIALLPERPAAWSSLGPAAKTACLDLGLGSAPAVQFLLGIDKPLYLSRHSPPTDMSPPGTTAYCLMYYLHPDEDPSSDELRHVFAQHALAAGIDPDGAEEVRYLHRMVACGALPTPETGGMRDRPAVKTGEPGVLVAGDWVGPVGHLADAALASGEAAARTAIEELARDPIVHSAA